MVHRERQIDNKTYMLDFDIEKVMMSLTPETKDLPPEDRRFFEGKVRYLIGKEIKLSNIPSDKLSQYNRHINWVDTTMQHPLFFNKIYVNHRIVRLLGKLGLPLSVEALAWKYGFMGFQQKQEHIKQELINIPTTEG